MLESVDSVHSVPRPYERPFGDCRPSCAHPVLDVTLARQRATMEPGKGGS
jgi:hypothetical protein